MPPQLSVRILLLALVVLIYCSSLLLFSGKTADTAHIMTDEAMKVVALAEEKEHELVIDLGTKTAEGGHPGFDWEEHEVLDDPQVIESVNIALGADGNKSQVQNDNQAKHQGSKQPVKGSSENDHTKWDSVNIPDVHIPEANSGSNAVNDDLHVSAVDNETNDAIYDQEEASEADEEDIIEFGNTSPSHSEDIDYSNVGYDDSNAFENPYDFMPLEFDSNLWEAKPRQLSLGTPADFPADMTKASPYITDYKDLSGGTFNSSRVLCKGLKCEERANAVIVILCRNSELVPMRRTIRQFEDRFNRRFQYPYVFLNDEPFNDDFKASIKALTTAKVTFGDIKQDMWSYPDFVNQGVAAVQLADYQARGVMYGGSLSYRHMCRFNSGFFYNHPLIKPYEYYWRVEPGVHFYCDLDYDPFLYMQKNGKQYGFNIALQEIPETIPTLWDHTMNFAHINNLNTTLLRFFGNPMDGYNLCHFWSNFEIANLNLWRRPEYQAYFHYLDSTGNFFYERWGDAIVHSLAAGMFLNKSEVHFFDDIGYKHDSFSHCTDDGMHGKCMCPEDTPNFDYQWGSCFSDWNVYPDQGKTWNFLSDGRQQLNNVIMAGHRGQTKPKSSKKTPSSSNKR